MFSFRKSILLLIFTGLFTLCSAQNKLIINEVSQGPSGVKEYVELVVTGMPICTTPVPCLDIRKYIIDDNNGQFQSGSGSGIASGAFRFADVSFWSCIPQGTIIIIYNDGDVNALVPAVDLSLTDGNCRLVIPVSSTLLEYHNAGPNTSSSAYNNVDANWTAGGGNWSPLGMANAGDSFQVRPNATATTADFSVSWGGNSTATNIYFSGSASTRVFAMINTVSTDFYNQANWQSLAVAGNESPGAPNSTANSNWLGSLNPTCGYIAPLSITLNATSPVCGGTCDGEISSGVTGGTAPYSYSWTNGAVTPSVSDLCAGTYDVEVTDASGCVEQESATLTISDAIAITLNTTAISCNASCDGAVSAIVSGGTTPYIYNWTNGAGTPAIGGLCAGTYELEVTDANGCVLQEEAILTDPAAVAITLNTTAISCSGSCDGAVSSNVSGGTTPYTYNWTNGSASPAITELCFGSYELEVTDANGCVQQEEVILTDPAAIIISLNSSVISCSGLCDGIISAGVSGGTAPYSYSWTNGAVTPTIADLCNGTYELEITDANGCVQHEDETLVDPTAIVIALNAVAVSCAGSCDGEITSSISGGSTPYAYNWTNGEATPALSGLCAGTYDLEITDANGCINQSQATVDPGADIQLTLQSTDETCAASCDGTASVAVSGGVTPYTYSWSNGGASSGITGLCPGTFDVLVSDANGCSGQAQAVINAGGGLQLTTQSTDETCATSCDGTASVAVFGGVTPYAYNWSNGEVTSGISALCAGTYDVVVQDAAGCSGQAQAVVNSGVSAGTAEIITTASAITEAAYMVQLVAEPAGGSWMSDCADCLSETGLLNGPPLTNADSFEVCYTPGQCWSAVCMQIPFFQADPIDEEFSIYIPNSVTVNFDGLNDQLTIVINNGRVESGEIYDRWGELVAKLEDGQTVWDMRSTSGIPVSDGVYTYVIYCSKDSGNRERVIGHINVLN